MNGVQFEKQAEHEQASADLKEIVDNFNSMFRDWEDIHVFGANFRFSYDDNGRKSLAVADIAPLNAPLPNPEKLAQAGEIIKTALESVGEPAANQEEVKYPELSHVAAELQGELRNRVKHSVSHVLMDILKENDVLLLSALGIDGRQKILDVFMEECQKLKEELQNGTFRSRYRS